GGRRVVVEVELRLRTVGDCCGVAGIGAFGVDLIQHVGRGRVLGGGVLAATTTATATATASTAATAAFRTGFALVRGRRGILRGRRCGRGVHVGCCRGFRAIVLDVVLLRRRGGDGGRSDSAGHDCRIDGLGVLALLLATRLARGLGRRRCFDRGVRARSIAAGLFVGLAARLLLATLLGATAGGLLLRSAIARLALLAVARGFVTAAITARLATALAITVAALGAVAAAASILGPGPVGGFRLRRRFRAGRLASEESHDPLDHPDGVGRCNDRGDRGGHGGGRFARLAQRCRLGRLDVGHRRRGREVEVGLGQRGGRQLARRAAVAAGPTRFLAHLVLTAARHFVVRGVQLLVGADHDRGVVALLALAAGAALLIEQVGRDLGRRLHPHLAGVVLHGVLFSHAQDRQR